jgi:hypothetical protein
LENASVLFIEPAIYAEAICGLEIKVNDGHIISIRNHAKPSVAVIFAQRLLL